MKKFTKAALAAVLALGVAGCSSSTSGSTTTEGGSQTLTVGLSGIKGTFNPMVSDTVYDNYVCNLVFEALLDIDQSGTYTCWLAESYELSEDNLTYTFTLPENATFSDGTQVKASDVAFTYNITKEDDYAGPRSSVGAHIASIDVIDDTHVAFTMTEASPSNLSYFTYGICSEEYYAHDSFEELTALNDKPMGSGKFVLTGYANKQYVNLERNENYWNTEKAAQIEGVDLVEISEDTILSALQAGEIDVCMPSAKAENVETIESMDNVSLHSYLGNGYTFMCFNTTIPQLNDVKCRQALMYALDRVNFLTAEYGSDQLVSLGMAPISPVSWAFPTEGLNDYAYDLDKANALLDEAGWTNYTTETADDGSTIEVRTNADGVTMDLDWLVYTDSTWPGTLSSMAFDSWKQIGVNLHIKQYDFATVSSLVMEGDPAERDFSIYTMGFSLGADPDPTGGLFDYDAYCDGGFNASGYYNERAQELIQLGKSTFDQDERAAYYQEWATLMNEMVPKAIVAYRSEIWGINNRVHGFDEINSYCDFTDPDIIANITLD